MIVDDGMSVQEAELLATPAPLGDYDVEITGFIMGKDPETGEDTIVVTMFDASWNPLL